MLQFHLKWFRNWPGERVGVIGGPGDRRDEDFVTLGKLSAQIFDRIIIKEDDDTRGRERGSAAQLIAKGIMQVKPDCNCETILNETEAINKALDEAPSGGLVVVLPETVNRAIGLIEARRPVVQNAQTNGVAVVDSGSIKSSIANIV